MFVCSDMVLTLPRLLTHRQLAGPDGLTVWPPRSSQVNAQPAVAYKMQAKVLHACNACVLARVGTST